MIDHEFREIVLATAKEGLAGYILGRDPIDPFLDPSRKRNWAITQFSFELVLLKRNWFYVDPEPQDRITIWSGNGQVVLSGCYTMVFNTSCKTPSDVLEWIKSTDIDTRLSDLCALAGAPIKEFRPALVSSYLFKNHEKDTALAILEEWDWSTEGSFHEAFKSILPDTPVPEITDWTEEALVGSAILDRLMDFYPAENRPLQNRKAV